MRPGLLLLFRAEGELVFVHPVGHGIDAGAVAERTGILLNRSSLNQSGAVAAVTRFAGESGATAVAGLTHSGLVGCEATVVFPAAAMALGALRWLVTGTRP